MAIYTAVLEDQPLEKHLELSSTAFLLCVVLTLVGVVIVANLIANRIGYTFFEIMSVVGILSSIALSAILAYLYYQMSLIQNEQRIETSRQVDLQEELATYQEQQNELLERQQKLQELEYKPRIQIVEWELIDGGIKLQLRNLGRGLAQNIAVRPSLKTMDSFNDRRLSRHPHSRVRNSEFSPNSIIDYNPDTDEVYVPTNTIAERADEQRRKTRNDPDGMLNPTEGTVSFVAPVKFMKIPLKENTEVSEQNVVTGRVRTVISPETFFEYLYNEGFRKIRFHIDLLYTDEMNNIYHNHVLGSQRDLKQGMTMKDIRDMEHALSGRGRRTINEVKEEGSYPPASNSPLDFDRPTN